VVSVTVARAHGSISDAGAAMCGMASNPSFNRPGGRLSLNTPPQEHDAAEGGGPRPAKWGATLMDLGLTWFDFAALAILGLSGVMAFARGLIREVFSVIAFIGGGIAGVFFARVVAPFIESATPLSGWLAAIAGGMLIFLVVFIIITVITSTVAKTAHQSTEIGSFDRAAGLAFGILRGVLVVALGVLVMRQATDPDLPARPPADPAQCRATYDPLQAAIRCARTYPIYGGVASALGAVLPQAGDRARDIINRQKGESAPIPPAEPASEPAAPEPQP
jgi:membrane protein required for colicin V production